MQYLPRIRPSDEDNVIAALEHPDRVCCIELAATDAQLAKMSAVIQQPFPVLTHLAITSKSETGLVLPSGFLGGFAPCLQELDLAGTGLPSLPTLLSSANNLVRLSLHVIPRAGYISSDVMAASLATLPRLALLDIAFSSYSDQIPLRPTGIIPSVLPSLQVLFFTGDSKYLEDFLARICTPQLDTIEIYYWNQSAEFVVPQLASFIDRSDSLKKTLSGHCQITVDDDNVIDLDIGPSPETPTWSECGISISVLCEGLDEQISHLANILGSISPILSDVVHLTLKSIDFLSESRHRSEADHLDDLAWRLLRQFSSVQTLFVSDNTAVLVYEALEYVNQEMITDAFPALELFFLGKEDEGEENKDEGAVEELDRYRSSIHKFLNHRRDYGHPVTFVETKAEFEERLRS